MKIQNENVLAARAVTHSFGTFTALNDVDFDVQEGEFVSLIGPSGCGKTTLLNLFAGFIQPSFGSCVDRHGDIRAPSRSRSVIFQDHALFPWLTVRQNVATGLEAKGLKKAAVDKIVNRWLSVVNLEQHVGGKYPIQLSGGMRQRVAFARSLALEPEVVLMDEPFGALDLLTREVLQEEVQRIREISGGSYMLITHSVDEAVFLSDRVFVMSPSPGEIVEIVEIDLPYPRTLSIRNSPEYLDYRARLTKRLREFDSG